MCDTEVAEKRYSGCVLRRVLATWQERHKRTRELAQFQELVEERGQRAVARRVIFHWKHCIYNHMGESTFCVNLAV